MRTVVVERADRLARDLMVQEVIVECIKVGVRILTADGVDLTNDADDPTRRLIRQVLGAVSEFAKRVIVLKLRAARELKRARGERVEGVKPYVHFPAEQPLVDGMRQLRRKPPKGRRLSVAAIAVQLNAEGHRNRAGREWSAQMVHHVLKSASLSSARTRSTIRPRSNSVARAIFGRRVSDRAASPAPAEGLVRMNPERDGPERPARS